jgi:hypothetical protein
MKIRHPEQVHCLHLHGWNTAAWCQPCRNHWLNSCGQLECRTYEQAADVTLAHAILASMEDGEIPPSPLLAEFDFVHLADMLEPSAN